jgi:hypothetical protein
MTLSLGVFTLKASAWSLEGHRTVGQIADSYLSKKARRAVADILGNETMAMVSNWADFKVPQQFQSPV